MALCANKDNGHGLKQSVTDGAGITTDSTHSQPDLLGQGHKQDSITMGTLLTPDGDGARPEAAWDHLGRTLRGTRVGRMHAALGQGRAPMTKGMGPGAPAQTRGSRRRLGPSAPLLPCRFPPLPEWMLDSEASRPKGRRRRRLRARRLAWRMAEWQLAFSVTCESNWPRDATGCVARLADGPLHGGPALRCQ